MMIDFNFDGIAVAIATTTSAYIVEFSPVILLMGGVVLALGLIDRLIDIFRRDDTIDSARDL